jgi:hypothetical protein
MPDDQITVDIIDFLFREGEEPILIDEAASIDEIASDPVAFLSDASRHFGIALGRQHLAMTVPKLVTHIRSARSR